MYVVFETKTVIVGNLTSDPQLNGDDNKVANFRMAVNRWRKPDQENPDTPAVDHTDFIDVECWGSQAENVNRSLKRGDRAIVAGRLKYDQWSDAEGNPRSKVRIRASAVGFSLEFQSV